MKIEKNYELRRCGNKLVLRRLCLSQSYEMKTVLVADELVDNEKSVNGYPFFVLRKGNEFVLCWEICDELQISEPCCKYLVHGHDILFQKESVRAWYMWSASSNEPILLGFPIGSFMELFVKHIDTGFMLYYYEDGAWCSKTCFEYELLDDTIKPEVAFSNKMFSNVLKIKTEEGELYLSIKKEFGRRYHYMGVHGPDFTQSVSYKFIFSNEP
jgi:hypothetical protein